MMKSTQAMLPLAAIKPNEGQIPGVPANPRLISKDDFAALCDSIRDNPEMLALRELLVVPLGESYVCLCGNMRLRALGTLGVDKAPCKVIEDADPAKLRRIALKDNAEAGEWDVEEMLRSWSIEELARFGVRDIEAKAAALDPDGLGEEFSLPDGEKPDEQTVSVSFSQSQAETVRRALEAREEEARQESLASGNKDRRACAFYLIMKSWAEQRK